MTSMLLLSLIACGKLQVEDPLVEPTDSAPPCTCDDGLWCNGVETCDADGACVAGTAEVAPDDGDPCTIATCDEESDGWSVAIDTTLPACAPAANIPGLHPLDHAWHYRPVNYRPVTGGVDPLHHLTTGFYGAVFDESTGSPTRLGALSDTLGIEETLTRDVDDVSNLPELSVRYEAGDASAPAVATGFTGYGGDTSVRAQMIDGGRYMNRLAVPTVTYTDTTLSGEVTVASMPRHLVLTQDVSNADQARIVLSGALLDALPNVEWLDEGRALTLTGDDGEGWLFVVYDTDTDTAALEFEGGVLTASSTARFPGSTRVSLLMAPTSALGEGEQALYLDPTSAASVTYTLVALDGSDAGSPVPAPWDPTLGAFRVDLGTLQDAGAPPRADFDDTTYHHWHGRHRLALASATPVSLPLALHGSDDVSWYITGGVPILRDTDGEPVGLPVQISKNWHSDYWYHFYVTPEVNDTAELELTVASSRWGDVFAASHAQLSLIGWSTAGGHWDESALGAFGESITYDPDVSLGRSMMDDVRPLLVDASGRWGWTGNVGGAEFLRYVSHDAPTVTQRVTGVRSLYTSPGPNLTDVTYAGVTSDGRIRVSATPRLVASDDIVRTFLTLSFEFLEDVEYDRLAFFQVAADNYSDNGFTRLAWGNADGVTEDRANAATGATGYATDADRGIALEGDQPWVFLYDSTHTSGTLPEHLANVGFIVREFEADIGGTRLTTPSISLYQTTNGGWPQTSFELSLPYEDGASWCGSPCESRTTFIPAGSTVRATLEYVVPPSDALSWYGYSDWLLLLDEEVWNTPEMMKLLAGDGAVDVAVTTGALASAYPIVVDAAEGVVAAELTLAGDLGYRPVSFRGLPRHDGWSLQTWQGDSWEPLDASRVGNDHWQATIDPDTGTWTLTYSVPTRHTTALRLVWIGG